VESRIEKRATGATTLTKAETETIKGKLIEFSWWLNKEGYSQATVKTYPKILNILLKRNVNLLNPQAVKEYLAKLKRSEAYKHTIIAAYTLFLSRHKIHWDPPKCDVTRKLPFVPIEKELDDLIAGCGKKTATFLQLLKETGMRCGEARRLEWSDIDFERRTITLNKPEKKGKPRIFNVSGKLIGMLNALPKTSQRIFPTTVYGRYTTFYSSRKRVARKLQNPRLLRISFHTFRHWKATMLYHQTKDILFVKEFLGHRNIETTLLYVQLEQALFKETNDEFVTKVARTPEEACKLAEVGFEKFDEFGEVHLYRKRK
jgi:integrase